MFMDIKDKVRVRGAKVDFVQSRAKKDGQETGTNNRRLRGSGESGSIIVAMINFANCNKDEEKLMVSDSVIGAEERYISGNSW